ncbi:MAG TPA: Asp23/Gls24 family envelope stress response protein [Anaerolineales bacterium]|nr:Asp23/Gls24 family envelope stress response protein [Anaerolineales bacterium]
MTDEPTLQGRIVITPRAIATIAAQAALRSYGVVGMASKNVLDGLAGLVVRDPRHGVEIRTAGDEIVIDLYVVIEYGTRISAVAASVAHTVQYQVERALGMPVAAVHVHVQDLRISNPD